MENLTQTEKTVASVILQRVLDNLKNSEVSEPDKDFYGTDESLLFSANAEDLKEIESIITKLR